MVVETFRYYAGAPRAAARPDDPGRRRRRHDLPRAARRGRADRALELPAADRLVEGGAGAGGGQHGRAEAGRADAADRARAGADRARGGTPRGRRSTWSPGPGSVCGRRLVEHPDVAKIAFTGSTEVGRGIAAGAAATIKRVTLELGGKSANVVFADADLERGGRGGAARRCSATPARTAARARGSWSSARRRPLPGGARARPSRRCGSATRSTRRPQMGPLISADQRETVASFVPDDAPVAIRGSAPDGPGYWFPPTVLAPVSNSDRAAARGDLRPGRLRDPVRRRGRGGRDRQRHDLRPLGLDLDPRRRQGAAGRAGDRDRRALDQLEHLGAGRDPVRRLQAVRRRPRAGARRARALHRGQERLLRDRGGADGRDGSRARSA